MSFPKVYAHCSYIGTTGFNNHSRDFFRSLSNFTDVKVRNFTISENWKGLSETAHDVEPYLTDVDRKILHEQTLWVSDGVRHNFKLYPTEEKNFIHDVNIILNETNHFYFYDKYEGPTIAYTVWESTLLPIDFFNRINQFEEIWTPTKWQKHCMVKQGISEDKIKVVPEGVDISVFNTEKIDSPKDYEDGRFKFILFGRWDYRKSTKEIIETFLKTFDKSEPVDLIISVDNMWGEDIDGMKSTEERLIKHNLQDDRIKIIHFPSREDYIKYIKTGHVFLSCARSEGWNLPLIEAMACGTPSIYSNCSGQLEFAEGRGIPVSILSESPASVNTYGSYTDGDTPGNFYEPNFTELSEKMRFSYEFYEEVKEKAVKESEEIRKIYNWDAIGKLGFETLLEFNKKFPRTITEQEKKNNVVISYMDGPKVEITGDLKDYYFIDFIDGDTNETLHSSRIENNMWTSCNKKYFINWVIKINGVIVERFSLSGKKALLSFESKSIGDTIAWAPYAVEFAKKNNCKVILSTFHNEWFKGLEEYQDIDFIEPGSSVYCDAVYRIGWFMSESGKWDRLEMHPIHPNTQELQKTATDILGLEFKELNYGIKFTPKKRPYENKYVVFAPESTTGCKEWTYDGWSFLSKELIRKGYDVVLLTTKGYSIPNTINVHGKSMNEAMNILFHSEFLIGLSSGLSWINWSLKKHTVMISGFSPKNHEFSTYITRIQNEHSCNSCWSNINFTFDMGDWDWCPIWKGTDKQHICEKSISPLIVLKEVESLL